MVNKREHKLEKGALKIIEIQRGMNRGRSKEFFFTKLFLYGPGLMLLDYNLGILYMLAMSSLATYGILLAGWSANSKYAFLGSLRSTAQLISYELILSSAILLVVLLAGSLDITVIIEAQRAI
jgi:NADH:ubiquinone oxidoreductase subunit H